MVLPPNGPVVDGSLLTELKQSADVLGNSAEELSNVSTQMSGNAEETVTQSGVVALGQRAGLAERLGGCCRRRGNACVDTRNRQERR